MVSACVLNKVVVTLNHALSASMHLPQTIIILNTESLTSLIMNIGGKNMHVYVRKAYECFK